MASPLPVLIKRTMQKAEYLGVAGHSAQVTSLFLTTVVISTSSIHLHEVGLFWDYFPKFK